MPINQEAVSKIITDASSSMKSKMMGGVSKESAEEALNVVAKKIKNIAEEAIGKAQKEIQECKNKTANEIAEITSKKDTAVFNAKQEAEKAIETAKAEVKTAKAVKTSKEVQLENGNTRTRKINKNGAIMTTEKASNGNKVSVEVEQLDGSFRKTEYDAASGKRLYTKTNTDSKKTYEYDLDGLNGKLSKDSDFGVVKKFIETNANGERTIVQELANGGKILTHEPVDGLGVVERFDKTGKLVEKNLEKVENGVKNTKNIKYGDDVITTVRTKHNKEYGYEISSKIAKDTAGDMYFAEKTERFSDRIEKTKVTGTNAFGDIAKAVKEIKPLDKNSKIASVKVTYDVQKKKDWCSYLEDTYEKAFVKLKDGRSLEYKFNIYDKKWSVELVEKEGSRFPLNQSFNKATNFANGPHDYKFLPDTSNVFDINLSVYSEYIDKL